MEHDQRAAIMLGHGYFPKELPPAFTSSDFGRLSSEIIKYWFDHKVIEKKPVPKYQGKSKKGAYLYKIGETEAETISAPKKGFERRNLHVTHPVSQAILTYEICLNWKSVHKLTSRQLFSLDRITVSSSCPRGIPDINFDAHRSKKSFIEATANWIVKTDITRFYPSIYTHSVPWAAYGKEIVKANRKLYDGTLADRIDQLLRACNRNQTVGIPIGPETSRIVAEIISSSVDCAFSVEKHGLNSSNVDRLQDDWFVGCSTLDQAELALSKIIIAYREFGLEINGSKTSIDKTSLISDQQWISELGSFLSHGTTNPHGRRLSEFLSLGIRMQVAYPGQPVINYIIAVIENQTISRTDAGVLESFLLRAITLAPGSLSGISRVLINLHHDTKSVSVPRVAKRLIQELKRNLENDNTLESIWLLYTIRGLSSSLKLSDIIRFVRTPRSSIISLILLDMKSRGLLIGSLPTVDWANFVTEDRARSSGLWLLAYEGIRHGWLADPYGLATKDVFKPMIDRNIVFYDPRRNVPTSKSAARRRKRARAKTRNFTFALIQTLRGFATNLY